MATWNNAANDAMQEAVNNHYVSNAEAAQLRSDISSWADMIGNERKKRFDIPAKLLRQEKGGQWLYFLFFKG